jgi:collagenase-like PrtC family protease
MRYFIYFWAWCLSWWGWGRLNRSMAALNFRLSGLMKGLEKSNQELQYYKAEVDRQREALNETYARQKQAVDRATGLNRQLQEGLVSANEALKTANEIVIPGLVAANQVFVDRWESESAVFAIRQVAARKDVE